MLDLIIKVVLGTVAVPFLMLVFHLVAQWISKRGGVKM